MKSNELLRMCEESVRLDIASKGDGIFDRDQDALYKMFSFHFKRPTSTVSFTTSEDLDREAIKKYLDDNEFLFDASPKDPADGETSWFYSKDLNVLIGIGPVDVLVAPEEVKSFDL